MKIFFSFYFSLDRLFILLESGSAAVTRKAAAKQIGEVQKLHPHELHNLLNRLIVYLHSVNWDTRVAAALAVQAILENVPEWAPKPRSSTGQAVIKEESSKISATTLESTRLSFDKFDLSSVLHKGARLLGSEGTEFDIIDDNEGDLRERLMQQRAMLSEKLGLNATVKIDDIVTLEDMVPKREPTVKSGTFIPVQDILNLDMSSGGSLSSREMNREKRKARKSQFANPINSVTGPGSGRRSSSSSMNSEEPERKRSRVDSAIKVELNLSDPVPDGTGSWGDATDWPLETFCSKLFVDLFNPKWEKRHGAATALRELLRTHSTGAGKSIYMTQVEMQKNHELWLEDAALRLLCVLALDRFGDFVSDQVIAPVRETCAQVLGTVLKEMPKEKVMNTVDVLIKFVQQKDWEVRHGGLLGLKYLAVVREDLIQDFIPTVLPYILDGMKDTCEDVGAVSASILIPIASHLPKLLTKIQINEILMLLWDLLLDQDELASACNSFMGLLAAILSLPGVANWIATESLPSLVPRLWPFLSHSTTSVRKATLQTLKTLTQPVALNGTAEIAIAVNPVKMWPSELLQEALRHIYQRVLVEHVEDVQNLVVEVWSNIVNNADLSALLHAACPYFTSWLCLAMQPVRCAFDPNYLISAKPPANKEAKRSNRDTLDFGNRVQQKLYLGGTESVPVDVREKNIVRARYKACRMLGVLSKYLVQPAPNVTYTTEMESPIQCYTKALMGHIGSRSALQRMVSAMVVIFWTESDHSVRPGPVELQEKLRTCVSEYVYYDEVGILFTRLLQEARDFLATLKQHKVVFSELEASAILTLDQIYLLCTSLTENLRVGYNLKNKAIETLEERRRSLRSSHQITSHEQSILTVSTQAVLSGALINLHSLPNEKFAPYVKPLMESIKREENEILQRLAAQNLAKLIDQVTNKSACPNNKIITNLCTMLRCDPDFTPKIPSPLQQKLTDVEPLKRNEPNPFYGILSLPSIATSSSSSKQNGVGARGPRPSVSTTELPPLDEILQIDDVSQKKQNLIQRTGAAYALSHICQYFGEQLPVKLPIIWDLLFSFLEKIVNEAYVEKVCVTVEELEANHNALIGSLQLLEVVAASIHSSLHEKLFSIIEKLALLTRHSLKAVRHLTARCLATLAQVDANRVMVVIINNVVPCLASIESVIKRQGAAEAIGCIINKLQFDIVPYVVLLIVPLLGRMSDPDEQVRLVSTQSFATLIQLMPLDGITPLTKVSWDLIYYIVSYALLSQSNARDGFAE